MTEDRKDRIKIGVFYDGAYFTYASNYYLYHHPKMARLSFFGFHQFIEWAVAKELNISAEDCEIAEAHFFKGKFRHNSSTVRDYPKSKRFGAFDYILGQSGITSHYLDMVATGRKGYEKGIDVLLTTEALSRAFNNQFSFFVLISGDGDFVPLVRKLREIGIKVMVLAWDLTWKVSKEVNDYAYSKILLGDGIIMTTPESIIPAEGNSKKISVEKHVISASKSLLEESNCYYMMNKLIEKPTPEENEIVWRLFYNP